MLATSLETPSERCDRFAMQSVSRSRRQCSPGLLGCARPMGSGQNIGTTKWQDRHRSNLTNQKKGLFPTVSAKFTSNAANVTKSFINIGFINLKATNPGMIDRFVSVLGFLVS